VPEFCTCGAQLPEDARFCHKCGKPQREEPVLVEETPAAEPVAPPALPPAAPEAAAISLRNGTAVRAALPAGALAFALLAVMGPFGLLAFVGAGMLAVYLYRRWTGERLSVMNGARLGWIAGIFIFVISTLLVTLSIVALSEPEVLQQAREQMARRSSLSEADINQMLDQLRTAPGIVATLAVLFLSSTLLPAFGGAIGAKLLDRG
jgi:hypothetical protein